MYTVNCTMYTVNCILNTVNCKLDDVYCILCIVHKALCVSPIIHNSLALFWVISHPTPRTRERAKANWGTPLGVTPDQVPKQVLSYLWPHHFVTPSPLGPFPYQDHTKGRWSELNIEPPPSPGARPLRLLTSYKETTQPWTARLCPYLNCTVMGNLKGRVHFFFSRPGGSQGLLYKQRCH